MRNYTRRRSSDRLQQVLLAERQPELNFTVQSAEAPELIASYFEGLKELMTSEVQQSLVSSSVFSCHYGPECNSSRCPCGTHSSSYELLKRPRGETE